MYMFHIHLHQAPTEDAEGRSKPIAHCPAQQRDTPERDVRRSTSTIEWLLNSHKKENLVFLVLISTSEFGVRQLDWSLGWW